MSKRALTMSFGLLVVVLVLAACGGGDSTSPTAPPAATATTAPATPAPAVPSAAATPRPTAVPAATAARAVPQGTLTIAYSTLEPTRFLQWPTSSATKRAWASYLYDYLIFTNGDDIFKLTPGLALSWDVAPDGRQVFFRMRRGVQFHGGMGEVTAADAKFVLEQNMSAGSLYNRKPQMQAALGSVEAPDPYTLVLQYKQPLGGDGPMNMSSSGTFQVGVTSKKYVESVGVEKADDAPVFSGPYRFLEKRDAQFVKSEALDSHWRLVPEFKTLHFVQVPEEATRVAMLKTNAADIVSATPTAVKGLARDGFRTAEIPDSYSPNFAFGGLATPTTAAFYDPQNPFLKKAVREAMNLAIDRKAIADSLYEGFATPSSTHTYYPFTNEFKVYAYNPARAKQLLAEAGYANGFTFTLWNAQFSTQDPVMPQLTQALAGYFGAVGIKATIETVQYSQVSPRVRAKDVNRFSWGLATSIPVLPYENIPTFFWSQGSTPYYTSPQIDAIYQKILASGSAEERANLFKQAYQMVYDDYGEMPIVRVSQTWVVNPKKVGKWKAQATFQYSYYWEYIQHPTALGTFKMKGIVDF